MSSSTQDRNQKPVNGGVLSLDLRRQGLESFPAVPFATQARLLSMDLSENRIAELPNDFCILFPLLQSLQLQRNLLRTVPKEIGRMSSLQSLYLDSNQIAALPDSVGEMRVLRVLSVAQNGLRVLPESLTSLAALQVLNLGQNELLHLPAGVGGLMALKELYLYHNRLETIPVAIWKLPLLEAFSLEWLRYTLPPLPVLLRGALLRPFRSRMLGCYERLKVSDCSFKDFVDFFSEGKRDLCGLIQQESDRLSKKYIGRSLLHIAVIERDQGVVSALAPLFMEKSATLLDREGYSPLGLAIMEENPVAAEKLIEVAGKFRIDAGSGATYSLLHLAVSSFSAATVSLLISQPGADVGLRDIDGNTPLHVLFSIFDKYVEGAVKIGEILVSAGADLGATNDAGMTPIHVAIVNIQIQAIKWATTAKSARSIVYERGLIDAPTKDEAQMTPLHLASKLQDCTMVQTLLDCGPNSLAQDAKGRLPKDIRAQPGMASKLIYRLERRQLRRQFGCDNKVQDFGATIRVTATRLHREKTKAASPPHESCSTLSTDPSCCVCEAKGPKRAESMRLASGGTAVERVMNNELRPHERYRALREVWAERCGECERDMGVLLANLEYISNKGLREDIEHSAATVRLGRRPQSLGKKRRIVITVSRCGCGQGTPGIRPGWASSTCLGK